jgi:hypothetical protein
MALEVIVKKLPSTEETLLIRADFSNDAAWVSLCEAAKAPSPDGFTAYLDCINDSDYQGLTEEQLVVLAPNGAQRGRHTFAFIADSKAFESEEHPILVVDLQDKPGRTIRVVPREMWSVENNLSTANMEFSDFANNTDAVGVFRGFPAT